MTESQSLQVRSRPYFIPKTDFALGELVLLIGDSNCRLDELLPAMVGLDMRGSLERPDFGTIRAPARESPEDGKGLEFRVDDHGWTVGTRRFNPSEVGFSSCDSEFVLGRTVLESVMLVRAARSRSRESCGSSASGFFSKREVWRSSDEKDAATLQLSAARLAAEFGLSRKVDSKIDTLSGGEIQRLTVLSAYVERPRLVVLDLTRNHLDAAFRGELAKVLGASLKKKECAALVAVLDSVNIHELIQDWGAPKTTLWRAHLESESQGISLSIAEPEVGREGLASDSSQAGGGGGGPGAAPQPPGSGKKRLLVDVDQLQLRGREGTTAPVTLQLLEEEFVRLVGPNGCGKTTFAEVLARRYPKRLLRYRKCFVDDGVCPLLASQFCEHSTVFQTPLLELPDEKLRRLSTISLSEDDLPIEYLNLRQRRLLSCATAIHWSRGFAILDEPTAGLDKDGLARLEEIFGIASEKGLSLLVITHDPWLTSRGRAVEIAQR